MTAPCRALLIDPGVRFLEKDQATPKPYPHIGIAYIAAACRDAGHEVRAVDEAVEGPAAVEEALTTYQPHVVGVTAMTFCLGEAARVLDAARRLAPAALTVLGGAHATALPEATLDEVAPLDAIVRGEGEITFPDICEVVAQGLNEAGDLTRDEAVRRLARLPGVYTRRGNGGPRPPIKDLDRLSFPDWSAFQYQRYARVDSPRFGPGTPLYQIAGSRGCPFGCSFCFPLHGRSFRHRAARSVVDEMAAVHQRFGARHFDFTDSTATVNRPRFLELCDLLVGSGLSQEVSWNFETRVNLVDAELLDRARRAGAQMVCYGVESADDEVLVRVAKGATRADAEAAVRLSRAAGLKVKISLIIGLPYETRAAARRTLDFARRLRAEYDVAVNLNIIDAYPGTEFFAMVDRGAGGTRWIAGQRGNWAGYCRSRPMVEVDDLDAASLLALYQEFTDEAKGTGR